MKMIHNIGKYDMKYTKLIHKWNAIKKPVYIIKEKKT